METILDSPITQDHHTTDYAGFWLRFVAAFVDGLVLIIPQSILSYFMFGSFGSANPMENMTAFASGQVISIVMGWLYAAFMESSANQATLGKMALGIKVTDLNGERISFLNATGRYFSKILSVLTLLIGYIMAAFTKRKQALHDIIAETLVVKSR